MRAVLTRAPPAQSGQILWRTQLSGNTIAGREAMLAALGERFRAVRW
jgi:hypothetical protein